MLGLWKYKVEPRVRPRARPFSNLVVRVKAKTLRMKGYMKGQ